MDRKALGNFRSGFEGGLQVAFAPFLVETGDRTGDRDRGDDGAVGAGDRGGHRERAFVEIVEHDVVAVGADAFEHLAQFHPVGDRVGREGFERLGERRVDDRGIRVGQQEQRSAARMQRTVAPGLGKSRIECRPARVART